MKIGFITIPKYCYKMDEDIITFNKLGIFVKWFIRLFCKDKNIYKSGRRLFKYK